MKTNPLETVANYVVEHFPNARGALLGGSVTRGDATETSDLDVIVLQDGVQPFRTSAVYSEWPIEVFVQSPDSLDLFFELERESGVPLLIRLFAEAVPVKRDTETAAIQTKAIELLEKGPVPWSQQKITQARYFITDVVDDLKGSTHPEEDLFTVNVLAERLHEFILRTEQRWIGESKWMYRSLKHYDENVANRFVHCLNQFYEQKRKTELLKFVDDVLAPYGGPFFDAYSDRM
ncbi:MAG TPA: nucleotidyltransferase domain-containing protein [Bacillales bacterium]|nr:nucleotidyltransferase domain-containing protein [Bacillales bacterium]